VLAGAASAAAGLLLITGCGTGSPSADRNARTSAGAGHASNAAARVTVTLKIPAALRSAPFDRTRKLTIPRGWHISLWARVPGARLATWTPDHRLLVSRPGSGDIVELTPRSGKTPSQRTLVSGLRQPHGMAFRGSTLYVAESHRVDTYHYAKGKVGARHTLISGLPDAKSPELGGAYAHALKSVVVGADGSVYVSVGSTGNISAEDRRAHPQRATILRWSPKDRKLHVFARGVRNGTGLAIDPSGSVWTAVNNRDQMGYPFHQDYTGDGRSDYGRVLQSYVNDHPLEPLAKLTAGRDLGWPYCDPDPSVQRGKRNSPLAYAKRPFVRDPDTNAGGVHLNCAKLPRIEQGLPAHSAPLGLTFAKLPAPYGVGAVVGSHGSWNRNPPRQPVVSFFHWKSGQVSGRRVLVSGFQLTDGSRWGRVVGVAQGPGGALYITDDQAGAVYRLATH
jgi:glucose/arabinose dehydrogenase